MFDFIKLQTSAHMIDVYKGTDIFTCTSVSSEFFSEVLDSLQHIYSIE